MFAIHADQRGGIGQGDKTVDFIIPENLDIAQEAVAVTLLSA